MAASKKAPTKRKPAPRKKAAGKHPGGLPTKYCPEMVAKAQAYLDGGYKKQQEVIPSTVGLSLCLDVNRSTIQEWGNDAEKPEFSTILDRIQAKQCGLLLNNGLTGAFNPAIAKLALGKHGYSDRVETESTHKGEIRTITRRIVDPAKGGR